MPPTGIEPAKSFTVSIAEWLERHAGKKGVAGLIPGESTYFHYEFFAYFPSLRP